MRSYIDRFRYKASKARQAQSRLKALVRLEIISPVHQENEFSFEFERPDHSPYQLVDLKGIDAGYDEVVLLNVNVRQFFLQFTDVVLFVFQLSLRVFRAFEECFFYSASSFWHPLTQL